jgi:hypothetical protein
MRVGRALVACALLAWADAGCGRHAASTAAAGEAGGPRELAVRVPAALRIARALDTLSVSIDTDSLGKTTVTVEPGRVLGVETQTYVFPVGQPRPAQGRHGFASGSGFEVGTATWSAATDGLPLRDVRYAVEMEIVLFETDVPPGHEWDPHAGAYRALWTRTLRQAEE